MSDITADNSGVTNRRSKQEWYRCDRCGFEYARKSVVNQNGLNVCNGAGTLNCLDKPGHSANMLYLEVPLEQRPEPLPNRDEDL